MKEIELEQKIEVCNYVLSQLSQSQYIGDERIVGLCQLIHFLFMRDKDYAYFVSDTNRSIDYYMGLYFPEFKEKLSKVKKNNQHDLSNYYWSIIPFDYNSRINFMEELKQELENKLFMNKRNLQK